MRERQEMVRHTANVLKQLRTSRLTDMRAMNRLCRSRWVLAGFVAAGIVRTVVLLLAYPPGHGSDSLVYYLYAERLVGTDFPTLEQLAPPLYPWLIVITHRWLGNVYLLVGVQVMMMTALAPIYYLALRKVSPVLAVLAGLVILGDVQTAIVANFTHTEPVYVFLLALLVYVLLAAYDLRDQSDRSALLAHLVIAGVLVGLLFYTRPVAKFLIIPVGGVVWLVLQRGRPLAALAGGFVGVLALYSLLSLVVVGQVEGLVSGLYMARRPTVKIEAEVARGGANDPPAEDGAPTSESQDTDPGAERRWDYIWPRVREFLLGNYWRDYFAKVANNTLDFLALSGQQYGYDPGLPSEVQCANPTGAQDIDAAWRDDRHFGWAMSQNENALVVLRDIVPEWGRAMCPPLSHEPELKRLVDRVATRYRSLGRPRRQLAVWYIAPLLVALAVPRLRRLLPLMVTMLALLLYHALISAVALNVQPRYVVVTNPFRTVLLVTAGYMVLLLAEIAWEAVVAKASPRDTEL